ncbi:MAG: hypothetical protein K2X82_32720 [Gemmataceae bacterium]|nr:hypothetical protein [Gemmataceae bacterium]
MASVWLVVAAAHLSDRYGLGHVAGSWIGLAWYARAGVLYPPLHSDGFYGGARCGPIPILLHGWGYRATGDPIAAGKLVGVAGTALMLTAGFVLLRRAGTPVGLAAVAVAVILMTDVGWQAGTTVNADGLAAGLQLAAVALVGRGGRFGSVAAGGACAAAFYVKASGVWAPLALTAYLALRGRRSLLPFLATGAVVGVALFGLFQWQSGGRMLENYTSLLLAGERPSGAARPAAIVAAARGVSYGMQSAAAQAWFLVPAAAVAVGLCVRAGRPTPVQMGLIVCAASTTFMFSNPGISNNHLLDLVALVTLAAAELALVVGSRGDGVSPAGDARPGGAGPRGVVVVYLALALTWLAATKLQVSGRVAEFREAIGMLQAGTPALDPDLAAGSWQSVFRPGDVVLSSDASIPVLMGQQPVVLDTFMLKRIADVDPAARDDLVRRIDRREFDWVVSVTDLRGKWGGDLPLSNTHWGPEVIEALERNYQRHGVMWGYYVVYARRPPGNP